MVFLKTSCSIQYFVGILIQLLNKLNKNSENDYSNQLFGMVFNSFLFQIWEQFINLKKKPFLSVCPCTDWNLHILNKCINLISYLYWRLWVNAINSISNEEIHETKIKIQRKKKPVNTTFYILQISRIRSNFSILKFSFDVFVV